MTRVQMATLALPANQSGEDNQTVVISRYGSEIGLAVTSEFGGDGEVWLTKEQCTELIAALLRALGTING